MTWWVGTHWVSGHHDSLKDQWSTDFKMPEPVIDVLICVQRAGGEFAWLNDRAVKRLRFHHIISEFGSLILVQDATLFYRVDQ